MSLKLKHLFSFAALLLLFGCDKPAVLFSGLTERQANPILAVLQENKISCEKTPGDEGTWNVVLPQSRNFAKAVELCEQHGLPQRIYNGVGDVFKKTGMVSSPTEERIRFMDALSQDLSRTISEINGVINARVHVVLPNNDPFSKHVLPSSAAVYIRHRYEADLSDVVPQIKNLVMNSIEGVVYEKITVILFRDPPSKTTQPEGDIRESQINGDLMRILVTANSLIFLLLILGGGYLFTIIHKKRKETAAEAAPKKSK